MSTPSIASTPRAAGASLCVADETALAALDVNGLTLGTRVYVSGTDEVFVLKVSTASPSSGSVVAVAGVDGVRWLIAISSALPATFVLSDASTTQAPDAIVTRHTTSATAAAGFGLTNAVELESGGGTTRRVATDAVTLTTATDAAEVAKRQFSFMLAGTLTPMIGMNTGNGTPLEVLTADGSTGAAINLSLSGNQKLYKSGSGHLILDTLGALQQTIISAGGTTAFAAQNGGIQFFSSSGFGSKQVSGADLTNNVTAGGTNDTIDNWTNLTTYATDAAAIRNAVYQLARKLAQVNNGLRVYGLLT